MTIKLTINLRDSSMPRKNEAGTPIKVNSIEGAQAALRRLQARLQARRKHVATLRGE